MTTGQPFCRMSADSASGKGVGLTPVFSFVELVRPDVNNWRTKNQWVRQPVPGRVAVNRVSPWLLTRHSNRVRSLDNYSLFLLLDTLRLFQPSGVGFSSCVAVVIEPPYWNSCCVCLRVLFCFVSCALCVRCSFFSSFSRSCTVVFRVNERIIFWFGSILEIVIIFASKTFIYAVLTMNVVRCWRICRYLRSAVAPLWNLRLQIQYLKCKLRAFSSQYFTHIRFAVQLLASVLKLSWRSCEP